VQEPEVEGHEAEGHREEDRADQPPCGTPGDGEAHVSERPAGPDREGA